MPSNIPLAPESKGPKSRFRRLLRQSSHYKSKIQTSSFNGISASVSSSSDSQKSKKGSIKKRGVKSEKKKSRIPGDESRGPEQNIVNRSSPPCLRDDIDDDSNATPDSKSYSQFNVSRSASKKLYRKSSRSSNNLLSGSSNENIKFDISLNDEGQGIKSSGEGSALEKAQVIAKFSMALNGIQNPGSKPSNSTDVSFGIESMARGEGGPSGEVATTLTPKSMDERVKLNLSDEIDSTSYNPLFTACNAALSFVGGVGSAVETCVYEINKTTGGGTHNLPSMKASALLRSEGSVLTLDTYERYELEDEIERLERLNSWETNGSQGTVFTLDTAGDTLNTGITETSNSVLSPICVQSGTMKSPSGGKKTSKKNRGKKKKKNKRKKVVHFEYPPISSMKEVPRVTTDQMKDLFFTEDELDQYDRDRRQNISDDVEVVAVEYSSEESDGDSDDGNLLFQAAPQKSSSSSHSSTVREGKWVDDMKDYKGRCIDSRCASLSSSTSFRAAASGRIISSPRYTSRSRSHDSSSASQISHRRTKREKGKLKGVQIYLRPRSTGRH